MVVWVVETTGRSSPTMIRASVLSAVRITGVERIRVSEELAASVITAFIGIFLAWRRYSDGPAPDRDFAANREGLFGLLSNAYYVDSAYQHGIADSTVTGSRYLWKWVDVGIIDAIANGSASAVKMFADSWRRWSTGNVQHYALTLLVGVVAVIAIVIVGGGL